MIVDDEIFGATRRGIRRILVRCDWCGKERVVPEYEINKQSGYTMCQKCRAAEICRRFTGTKRSDDHRRRTGLASRGRTHTDSVKRLISMTHKGENNKNWNPDREAVKRNEISRRACYGLLHGVLTRIGVGRKLDKTHKLLGYSSIELYNHISSLLEPGMSWDRRSEWHIDHIKPIYKFVAEGVTDLAIINALTNLRPIWAKENMARYWRDSPRRKVDNESKAT